MTSPRIWSPGDDAVIRKMVLAGKRSDEIVKEAISKRVGGKRPGAGRPTTGRDPPRTFRLSDQLMAEVEGWAADQRVTKSEAIRRLVELGLKAKK